MKPIKIGLSVILVALISCSDQYNDLFDSSEQFLQTPAETKGTIKPSTSEHQKSDPYGVDVVDTAAHPMSGYEQMINVINHHLSQSLRDNQNLETSINVSFVVDETGQVLEAVVTGGQYFTTDYEKRKYLNKKAIEAIKLTSGMWKPAVLNGKAVASRLEIPLTYS